MKLSFTKVAVGLKEYIVLGLGMFLYAFGWTACVIPAGGMGGGATGMGSNTGNVLLDTLAGVRTRQIQRKLSAVQSIDTTDTPLLED